MRLSGSTWPLYSQKQTKATKSFFFVGLLSSGVASEAFVECADSSTLWRSGTRPAALGDESPGGKAVTTHRTPKSSQAAHLLGARPVPGRSSRDLTFASAMASARCAPGRLALRFDWG